MSSLPRVGVRTGRLDQAKAPAWLVNAATPDFPGHPNNAVGAPVVPRLPVVRLWTAGFDRRCGSGLASTHIPVQRHPYSGAEEEREMAAGDGIEILGTPGERFEEILTPEALQLVATLQREFGGKRAELLAARAARQRDLSAGGTLDFLPETRRIRGDNLWRVPAPAPGLVDRRVEITGPTERKMTINALNSGANVWLADFEDANTPLWENMITGQLNLCDALDRTIDFTSGEGKDYRLRADDELATIVVRPRGWHLDEKHVLVDGQRVSGSLFDFALYFFHYAQRQLDKDKGPYFYLAKMESHLEARLWNDVFGVAQAALGLPRGTIRATVLIETIPAAFEMDEILYELRDHSAGLNAGRWDYLFSIIKKFRSRGREFVLPERNS